MVDDVEAGLEVEVGSIEAAVDPRAGDAGVEVDVRGAVSGTVSADAGFAPDVGSTLAAVSSSASLPYTSIVCVRSFIREISPILVRVSPERALHTTVVAYQSAKASPPNTMVKNSDGSSVQCQHPATLLS